MSKLIVQTRKPRNPLVAPARFRQAGRHGGASGEERRQARRALERELRQLDPARAEPPGL